MHMTLKQLRAHIQARRLALKRRLALAFHGRFDPTPPPRDMALSPSRAHFADYQSAPLRLSWRTALSGKGSSEIDRSEVASWQESARAKLAELTGYSRRETPIPAGPPRDFSLPGGLTRRRVYLHVDANADVPVDLVWTNDTAALRPVMLCLHGHNAGAHLSWGEARWPADPLKIVQGADYALQAAARGFVAVCIEQSCFGERREREIARPSAHPCFDAAHHALLLGRTLLGERVADVSSVIDWLMAGDPGAPLDAAEIYAMGNSTGGEVALYTGALDTRLAGVIASGCIGYFRDNIGRRAACPDAIVPGILEWMEADDIVALAAPRPVLAVSGVDDHIYPFAGVEAVIEEAANVYRELGAEGALAAAAGAGGHRFYPDVAWPRFMEMMGRARETARAD